MTTTAKADYIWFNGEMIKWDEAKVHVMSHALHYGTSVFEGVRCYETHNGPAVFRHREHMQRLHDSAKIYRMPGPEALEQGIDAMVSSWNRSAPNTIPTAAKAGGNYLSSLLVGSEARRHGYQEGIALDVHGYVSEGAGENIFIVKNNILFTPTLTSAALPGITRDAILTLARDLGIEIREQTLSRESLYLADEVFMTGTAAEITPVRSIDGIQVGIGRCGPTTKRIQQAFFGLFNGKTEDKYHWLDSVK